MRTYRLWKHDQILWRYIFSYLLISLIPILIFGTIYYSTALSTIKGEVEKQRLDVVANMLGKIDFILSDFNAISLHFSNYINTANGRFNYTLLVCGIVVG